MVSRRRFLVTGSKVALAAGLVPSLLLGRSHFWERPVTPAGQLTPSTFRGLERAQFAVRSGLLKTNLELVSISQERVRPLPGTGKIVDFSLIFRGSSTSPLEQDTYRFEHGSIGSFDLFVVPVDDGGSGQQHYQVIFNQLLA